MKTMKLFFKCAVGVAIPLLLNSCDLNDSYSLGDVWYSLATVKPLNDSKTYSLTLDNGKTLWLAATNVPEYKPKENQRALIYYTILSDTFQRYDHAIQLHNIRNILTKSFVEKDLIGDKSDAKYGTDPVRILGMWMGDGYLNVHFGFNYGGTKVHYINLIHRPEVSKSPYYFEFRHNAYGDPQRYGRKGLVAFDMSKLNVDKEVTLTIRVKTFNGDKEYKVKYKNRASDIVPYSIKEHNFNDMDFVATK